jgi:hypothetical protein
MEVRYSNSYTLNQKDMDWLRNEMDKLHVLYTVLPADNYKYNPYAQEKFNVPMYTMCVIDKNADDGFGI